MVTELMLLGAVLGGAGVAGLAWRRRDGRFRSGPSRAAAAAGLKGSDLGGPLGARATLVQFSSSFCAPCRPVRKLLSEVAAGADGVSHIEIDVTERMDLVRRLGITRTPTVLVLGPGGQISQRASGMPGRGEVNSAIARAAGGQET